MVDELLAERFELSAGRVKEIYSACGLDGAAADYFTRTAGFILQMLELFEETADGRWRQYPLDVLEQKNKALYQDILKNQYDKSYANPAYACAQMGEEYGRLLSFLYVEIRGMIVFAVEQRQAEMTALMELFIEIYCMFENERMPYYKSLQQAVYWHVSDYSDDCIAYRVREQLDSSLSFASGIIMEADLTDLRYLYWFGEYITENELRTAAYLNSLPQAQIEAMAHTFVEGYRKGFELGNKDISKKKTVNIRYCLGFERLVREEIRQFKELGLSSTVFRAAVHTINKRMDSRIGYFGTSPNRQMDYDHRFDCALYLDAPFVERKLGALKNAYEKYKAEAAVFGGPAVMEIFGEEPFEPADRPECLHLDKRQQKLSVRYDSESSAIVNEYIRGDERSFTIIAYPVPEIGSDFEAIFTDTVRINTLDYEQYRQIQQKIIDVLDQAEYVEIIGANGNKTDMQVRLMHIEDHACQTVFENCLADVNIPLGEVFTSPVLAGTKGTLNVGEVYLNGLKFKDLKIVFDDGWVREYSCGNFDDDKKNREYFRENVLYNQDSLPLGEFAIGTNTSAYVMARRYNIVHKLPILIVEKMGPHFAIGDTCYSRTEDVAVYNPDGKEIISRDNEVSRLRTSAPEKAYFNCHTDITVPYDEIGRITAVMADSSRVDLIRDGRFALEGCEELNRAFEQGDCG